MTASQNDWNPGAYDRFRGLRLRPALDLLAQVGTLPPGPVVDLGCGSGAVAGPLATRFPGHDLTGVDSSDAMLAEAEATGQYRSLIRTDIAEWQADSAPALIFSNAALHWISGHERLLPRLAAMLAPGGVLAVQMPRQFGAPSHRFLRDIAQAMFAQLFDFSGYEPPVQPAHGYWRLLSGLGRVHAWETEYVQRLDPVVAGHPVRAFTESTAMRPFLQRLSRDEGADFIARYDAALAAAYPLLPDGGALLPFRRVFFVLEV